MNVVSFDLESDGLHFEVTKVHCISLSVNGEDPRLFVNRRAAGTLKVRFDGYIEDALDILRSADVIVGHNIIDYDLYVLEKLYDFHVDILKTFDTLLASRIIYGDTLQKHSLEAWGSRLGVAKGDFGKQPDAWDTMTDAMGLYCNQDVVVTNAIYRHMMTKVRASLPPLMWDTERKVAKIIRNQKMHGVLFDTDAALKLYAEISKEYNRYSDEMREIFPPICKMKGSYTSSRLVPKRDNSRLGYLKGVECFKIEVVEFNPNSRQHIATSLIRKYGWTPTKLTPTGQPQVDEAVLNDLPYPEAKSLAWLMLLKKRLGQIHDGDNGWLKVVKDDGRIHGSVNTNGAVTGRMTHSSPNMAQVPSTKHGAEGVLWGAEGGWGADCRALFVAPKGRKLVGCDFSGLELRCLAHYLARWDGGEYTKELLEGDIHTVNQEAAGLPTRDNAKTFIYGFLYGAGPAKLGSIIGRSAHAGRKLREKFLQGLPALKSLLDGVSAKAQKEKHLRGLDGRILRVRHQHAALNTLLQGAGAAAMKQALVHLHDLADTSRFDLILTVHDEADCEVDEDYVEEFCPLIETAFRMAGETLGFRCPLEGEAKVGDTWLDIH